MIHALLLTFGAVVSDSAMVYRGAAGELHVRAPLIEDAALRLDGRLDDAVWARAAVLTGFTQYEPVEGVPAADDTEVRVFYTTEAIYFGIRAHDRQPERIRATLAERDRAAFTDDWVRIMLDTFDDQRQAYSFYVNPLGIQTDGLWIEGGVRLGGSVPIDFNPDYIWQSEGRVEGDGWTAEIRIPYVGLRFRAADVQSWGINIARETRRNGFKSSWAPLTQNRTSTLGQGGKLLDLRGLRPRRLVEMNPVATGKRTGELGSDDLFAMGGFQPDVGVNGRIAITQNLVVDATINPDFSQVEADADQITINERFALFLSEKRPFFLEGGDVFRTPQQLVYTRAIVDPVGGARMTGKLGSFNVGYLGAIDESARRNDEEGELAGFNIVRVRRDLGAGSTVGALYTDRTLLRGGAYNRVLGVDARVLFRERYTLTAQLAESWSRAPGDDVEPVSAPLLFSSLERSGSRFGWQAVLEDIAPDFRAQSGFVRRIGDTRAMGVVRTNAFGSPGALLQRWGMDVRYEAFFDHDDFWRGDSPFESEIQLEPNVVLRGANSIRVFLRRGYFRFDPELFMSYQVETAGGVLPFLPSREVDNMLALALMPRLRPADWFQLEGRMFLREIPIYAEATGGFEFQLAPSIRLWPTDGLSTDLSLTRSRIWRSRDESLFSTQDISRVKAQYQFSKALFTRAIVQYNLRTRDVLRDPSSGQRLVVDGQPSESVQRGDFGLNLLVSYQPSPGTLMYLGWARQMAGPETYRVAELDRTAEGLFVKVSYLVRL